MKASLIAIGDEILTGQTVNTNSAWIAERLHESLQTTKGYVQKANNKAKELESEKHQQRYMHVNHLLTKSASSLENAVKDEPLLQDIEKDIAEAYRLKRSFFNEDFWSLNCPAVAGVEGS